MAMLPTALQKLGSRVPGTFYKFFNTTLRASDWSCGHSECPHEEHVSARTPQLISPVTNNTDLQGIGATGIAPGRPSLCANGWHAVEAAKIGHWPSHLDAWRRGSKVLWCVTLYGSRVRDGEKIAARGIRMERQVAFESPEGKRIRQRAHKSGWEE